MSVYTHMLATMVSGREENAKVETITFISYSGSPECCIVSTGLRTAEGDKPQTSVQLWIELDLVSDDQHGGKIEDVHNKGGMAWLGVLLIVTVVAP